MKPLQCLSSGPSSSPAIVKFANLSKNICVITWNARALCCADLDKRRKKLQYLNDIASSADVILLQEVHREKEFLEIVCYHLLKDFFMFHSACHNHAAGGVVTLIRRSCFPKCSLCQHEVVLGRVMRVSITDSDGITLDVWNIHNFGIPETSLVVDRILDDVNTAKRYPMTRAIVFGGDFNFHEKGEGRFHIRQPGKRYDTNHNDRACSGPWARLIDAAIELMQPDHTHITTSSMTTARLDRIYLGAPSWAMTGLSCNGSTMDTPQNVYQRSLSDHAPVQVRIAPMRCRPPSSQPIAHSVAASKFFRERLAELESQHDLDSLLPVQRWKKHKELIKMAGKAARNDILLSEASSGFAVAQVLISLARAVNRSDINTANILIKNSGLARRHAYICDGQIFLLDASAFAAAIDNAKTALLKADIDDLSRNLSSANTSSSPGRRGLHRRMAVAQRHSLLWSPVCKKKVLAGIVVSGPCGKSVVRGGDAMASALASAWAPTFAHKEP